MFKMSSMNVDTHFYMMYGKNKYCFYLAYYISEVHDSFV